MADTSTTTAFPATGADARAGELAVRLPEGGDAGLFFIGRIRTPWASKDDNPPRKGDDANGPICRLELDARWTPGLLGLEAFETLQVLYWMDRVRRDLVVQHPRRSDRGVGTFSTRSPLRPNPIGSSLVRLVGVQGSTVLVRGLDCLDMTPLIDIKPEFCPHA